MGDLQVALDLQRQILGERFVFPCGCIAPRCQWDTHEKEGPIAWIFPQHVTTMVACCAKHWRRGAATPHKLTGMWVRQDGSKPW